MMRSNDFSSAFAKMCDRTTPLLGTSLPLGPMSPSRSMMFSSEVVSNFGAVRSKGKVSPKNLKFQVSTDAAGVFDNDSSLT